MRSRTLLATAWVFAACASGSPEAGEGEMSPVEEDSERARVEDCVRSLCGCWEPVILEYEVRVGDAEDVALSGIELFCLNEKEPIAVSDENGRIGFAIETEYSPGCRYARCMNLLFHDPEGRVADRRTTVFERQGGILILGGGSEE